MRKILLLFFIIFAISPIYGQNKPADPLMVELARVFSKDLFEYNGIAYAKPIPIVSNASINAGFFNDAYVPINVEKPYFRIKLNGMLGFVNDELKTFNSKLPMKQYTTTELLNYLKIGYENGQVTYKIQDTVGLFEYLLLNLIYDGVNKGMLQVPGTAQTAMGSKTVTYLNLPPNALDSLFKMHPLYGMLPIESRDTLSTLLRQFPSSFPMPSGSDISTLLLGVPQVEIGSLFGTELLVRLIPPIDLGKTFGKFAFWGIGLKHNISQYFFDERNPKYSHNRRPIDIAIQTVYQGTNLQNTIGVTNAQLTANANIYNVNLHVSKQFNRWFILYSGLSWEQINIDMQYKYYLPVELQWQLGLLETGSHKPTPGYPGDQNPSTVKMNLTEQQVKFTAGCKFNFDNFAICADYSLSKFNIFSFGLQYTINNFKK